MPNMKNYFSSKSYCKLATSHSTKQLIVLKRSHSISSQPFTQFAKSESNESIAESPSSEISDTESCPELDQYSITFIDTPEQTTIAAEATATSKDPIIAAEAQIIAKNELTNSKLNCKKFKCKNCQRQQRSVVSSNKTLCKFCTKKQKIISKNTKRISQSRDLLRFNVRKECYNMPYEPVTETVFDNPFLTYECEEDHSSDSNDLDIYAELIKEHLHNMNVSDYSTYGSKHTKYFYITLKNKEIFF